MKSKNSITPVKKTKTLAKRQRSGRGSVRKANTKPAKRVAMSPSVRVSRRKSSRKTGQIISLKCLKPINSNAETHTTFVLIKDIFCFKKATIFEDHTHQYRKLFLENVWHPLLQCKFSWTIKEHAWKQTQHSKTFAIQDFAIQDFRNTTAERCCFLEKFHGFSEDFAFRTPGVDKNLAMMVKILKFHTIEKQSLLVIV